MADAVEQFREEWDETDRLEKELVERQVQENAIIDVINSGLDWSAEPGNTQSGHAKSGKIAKRLVEAVSHSEVRHGAEIVAKFMRARLEMEEPGSGRNRRKAVLGVIEHACSGERAPVAKLLDAILQKWERGAFWRDFSDAWIAIHVCRKFDSYDQIADCRDFDAVRRQALRWREGPAVADNGTEAETLTDSGQAGGVPPIDLQVPAGHPDATDEPEIVLRGNDRVVKEPSRQERQAYALWLTGMTQEGVAERVFGSRKKQYKVSRAKTTIENYLRSCGIPEESWKQESEKPEFITMDPGKIDLGQRVDRHTQRQRDQVDESD